MAATKNVANVCYPHNQYDIKAKMLDMLEGGVLFSAEHVIKDHDKKVATKIIRAVF